MTLTRALHRTVQQDPAKPMTVFRDRTRTHGEVFERVSRLGGALRGLGVGDGDRVAILALNSDRYSDFLLGTAWAGGVVNPQNIRWAPPELAFALNDSETGILFVDDLFAGVGEQLLVEVDSLHTLVYVGDAETPPGMLSMEELIAGSDPAPDRSPRDHEMVGLFYTGGTTGQPKGVMLSAANLLTSALGSLSSGSFVGPDARFLHAAPMFHLADLAAWFSVLQMGGQHVIVSHFDVPLVLEAIQEHHVSDVLLVPTMIQMVTDAPSLPDYHVTSLERIIYGASPIDDDLLARAMKAFPNVSFSQAYGMTELSPVATMLSAQDHLDELNPHRRRSAGRAAPHAMVTIVRDDGSVADTGEVGEIVVAGPHVMLGYWRRPDETAAALQPDGMHTGDAGYLDADGYLFVVDRIKDMIISGGENIYSAEVENALCAHPAVATCAVVGVPDDKWGEIVHAVVVLQPGAEATADDLVSFAREQIAGYKVPRRVTFTDALPISGAGKVLKRVLRDELATQTHG
ncbi:MAG TPA: long-chain fatty acid--CoA ligase [Mycobacteriales bacterium]|nr:long-chain fatty acid--CoA ligase [Mycobacteriales bacterium]